MMNFVDWLTEYFSKEDSIQWKKNEVIDLIKTAHKIILSEDPSLDMGKHYGDCTNENVTCRFCEYQNWLDKYEKYCRDNAK